MLLAGTACGAVDVFGFQAEPAGARRVAPLFTSRVYLCALSTGTIGTFRNSLSKAGTPRNVSADSSRRSQWQCGMELNGEMMRPRRNRVRDMAINDGSATTRAF